MDHSLKFKGFPSLLSWVSVNFLDKLEGMNARISFPKIASLESATQEILTKEALEFLLSIHDRFEGRRQELLGARRERQKKIDAGEFPQFLK